MTKPRRGAAARWGAADDAEAGSGARRGAGGEQRWQGAGGFASAVGEERFWVPDPFVARDPNQQMGLVFGFPLLETV